ncbi:hypothetical protein BJ875DRAFT_151052 [Amylocarpus encephaloides]|uniref:Uncharacterized protein n=1 Tax=Amylocarpus encephaloides TaxID=45428 RepID=A0A9P7YCJ1_9HELO|nr:hypothetical protein BJ875DRAFT_151052 [Amylocarpus encephaloides]
MGALEAERYLDLEWFGIFLVLWLLRGRAMEYSVRTVVFVPKQTSTHNRILRSIFINSSRITNHKLTSPQGSSSPLDAWLVHRNDSILYSTSSPRAVNSVLRKCLAMEIRLPAIWFEECSPATWNRNIPSSFRSRSASAER